MTVRIGIEALNVHAGFAQLSTAALFEGRGLDHERIGHLMMRARSIALPCEDPITNAVNAAAPIVGRLAPQDKERIELILTSSESGVDFSKSIASYVHEFLGLSPKCRVMEVKQGPATPPPAPCRSPPATWPPASPRAPRPW
ncbi:3-hydroxy-3-methylglutaryl CoA synthase [Streptomyces ambofaciens]